MSYKLQWLHDKGIPPLVEEGEGAEAWETRRSSIEQIWLSYLGTLPTRENVQYDVIDQQNFGDHTRWHIKYKTNDDDLVTAYLLFPADVKSHVGRKPAMMALHPTIASGKADIATSEGRDNRKYALELVQRGYIVLAPDTITAGERISSVNEAYQTASFYEQYPGWTAVGKMLLDHQYGVDLLCSLPEVDADRIGAIGHSLGGYNSYFLAGMDQRIKAFVSSCGFSTFAGDPILERWGQRDWFSHIPRLSADVKQGIVPFEWHEIAALAAPIPAFFYSGQQDSIFPNWAYYSQGMNELHKLYERMDRGSDFRYVMSSGGHDFPAYVRQLAYSFLDEHLARRNNE